MILIADFEIRRGDWYLPLSDLEDPLRVSAHINSPAHVRWFWRLACGASLYPLQGSLSDRIALLFLGSASGIAGSPTTVVKQIEEWHNRGIGHLLMMNHAGSLSTELTRRSMKLFAEEVYPEIRELRGSPDSDGVADPPEPQPAVQERVMRAEG